MRGREAYVSHEGTGGSVSDESREAIYLLKVEHLMYLLKVERLMYLLKVWKLLIC